jgi:hypothetical protein
MSANKTKETQESVSGFLDSIEDPKRRADCDALLGIMQKATGKPAAMWGASIVGFDTYRYRYASGREGDWMVVGFSPRKSDLSVYLICSGPQQAELLGRLGRHKMGKSCISIRSLADVDLAVLEQLVADSVAENRRVYGQLADDV